MSTISAWADTDPGGQRRGDPPPRIPSLPALLQLARTENISLNWLLLNRGPAKLDGIVEGVDPDESLRAILSRQLGIHFEVPDADVAAFFESETDAPTHVLREVYTERMRKWRRRRFRSAALKMYTDYIESGGTPWFPLPVDSEFSKVYPPEEAIDLILTQAARYHRKPRKKKKKKSLR